MLRKFQLAVALTVCLALTACGSVTKTAYNSLVGLKAAYVVANQGRIEYCHPKPDPKPKICADSYAPLLAGYETLKTGTALLTVYEQNKDAATKDKLVALIPVAAAQTLEILRLNWSAALPAPAQP